MTVEEAILARIGSIGAVTALVSTRLYLDKLPQSPTYPCVRVTRVDNPLRYHLRGGVTTRRARVQVDSYAREVSGVNPRALVSTLAEAIHGDDAGSGLSGFIGGIGSPAFQIAGVFRVDWRRSYDPEELRVLTISQDYDVAYTAM